MLKRIASLCAFLMFASLLFSQEIESKEAKVIKDTMIIDARGFRWNCMLYSDSTSKVSFFGLADDSRFVRCFYTDKLGAFYLKKELGLKMKIKKNQQKINTEISVHQQQSPYTESFQVIESSSPGDNQMTPNNYRYLKQFFAQYEQVPVVYEENGFLLGYGITFEIGDTQTIWVEIRFHQLPSYRMLMEGSRGVDDLGDYLYFSIWKHKNSLPG